MKRRVAAVVLALACAVWVVSPSVAETSPTADASASAKSIAKKALALAKKNKKKIKAIGEGPEGPAGPRGPAGVQGPQGLPGEPVTFRRQTAPTVTESVLSVGGLEITYACGQIDPADTADLILTARSTVNGATITAGGTRGALGAPAAFLVADDTFNSGQTLEIGLPAGGGLANPSYVSGQLTFATPGGNVVSVVYDGAELVPNTCRAAGTAVGP